MRKLVLALLLSTALIAEMPKGISLLEMIDEAYTELADKSKPATVAIKCVITASEFDGPNPFDMFGDEFFRRFFGEKFRMPEQRQQIAGGSGFLISADGYIVTNNHVIKNASEITVTLNDGREYTATPKGSDSRTDLAVIKIEETDLPFLTFGDSDKLKAGQLVVAIGNPLSLEGTVTKGIVSAKGRQDLGIALYEDFIQTDAAINPGNSGGPLLNARGEVVGVNTAIFSKSGGYMGIGLAIPSKMVQPVIEQIMHQGSVKRAFLGVVLQPLDKDLSDALELVKQDGILISEVVKDSPAFEAGLKQGDIITEYNNKPAKNVTKFRNEIATLSPSTTLALKILRNNKPLAITVKLGLQPDEEVLASVTMQKLGIEMENLTPELAAKLGLPSDASGIVISGVKPNSPAAQAGLRPSFLITAIGSDWNDPIPVKNLADFDTAMQQLGDKKHLILIVRHQNFQRYYTVKLEK